MKNMNESQPFELSTDDSENLPEAVLAKFENGILVNPETLQEVKCYSDNPILKDVNKFKRKMLVAETDHMQYSGANFGPYSSCYKTCCDYYIGLVDKKTNKVKLMNCEWYNLKPAIAGSVLSLESNEDKADEKMDKDFRIQSNILTASFGSLKRQRAVESRARHEVETEDLVEVIQTTIQSVPEDVKPISITIQNPLSDTVPPIKLDATNVQDVYDINDLISAEERSALQTLATSWAEASKDDVEKWLEEKRYAGFVLDCLQRLPVNKETRLHKCTLLIYLHFLTTLTNLKSTDFRQKDPLPKEIPSNIKKNLLDKYFQTTGKTAASGRPNRNMSVKQKDKLIANIIVLALMINDFEFEYSLLLPDLKTTATKFQLLIRAVGAKLEKIKSGKQAKPNKVILSLPLATLEPRKMVSRRNK